MAESTANVERITGADELASLVDERSPVLAEFYSRSCPKCDAMEPVVGGVAHEFEGTVAMVDPGEDLSALRSYGVASTPGFVRFVEGNPVATLAEGVVSAERLLAFARGEGA
jgi:thioredoxin 1